MDAPRRWSSRPPPKGAAGCSAPPPKPAAEAPPPKPAAGRLARPSHPAAEARGRPSCPTADARRWPPRPTTSPLRRPSAGRPQRDESLVALGAKILQQVLVTPPAGGGLTNDAFLGVRSAPADIRSIFPIGKL
ncbi:neural Wiskott-Aldrich syndrome protein-like [Setaria italica]|uniref:neural Wiskott-Aldrich syndrome protein-like n=1 Tax=Setaria italica TaxID=4555 RepID=UPI000350FBE1|nr:neural Wiskott-Aldrich syndrome protein-like [Setaria italica]